MHRGGEDRAERDNSEAVVKGNAETRVVGAVLDRRFSAEQVKLTELEHPHAPQDHTPFYRQPKVFLVSVAPQTAQTRVDQRAVG